MRRLLSAIGTTACLGLAALPAHAGAAAAATHQRVVAPVVLSGTARDYLVLVEPAPAGIAYLTGSVDLRTPNRLGDWVNIPLQATLPQPGTYELDLNVRSGLNGTPPVDAWVVARLWNVTANSAVPNSHRIVNHVVNHNQGDALFGHTATAPINERITVSGPTTIQLQAKRVISTGNTNFADVRTDENGATSFRFERVSA